MELKRGKTFIKSSLQISHEKAPDSAVTIPAREDVSPSEMASQAGQNVHSYDRGPGKGVQSDPEGTAVASGTSFRLVRKSKTHDNVSGASRAAGTSGQLVASASFSGPSGGQRMIDYRHFVPQMPFVPAVAKSIPRKRISLKRPKKCFWNLFHLRRNKAEGVASLVAKGKSLASHGGLLDVAGRRSATFLPLGEDPGLDGLCQDLCDGDLLLDSSFELCRALCEDVASLKSFDSLTGCGEIFADESSVPSLELNEENPDGPARVSQSPGCKTTGGPVQGGVEKLASPAQNEASDFSKFWDSVNRSVTQQHRALLGPWSAAGPQGPDTDQARPGDAAGLAELPLCPCSDPPRGSKASSIDTSTPKSEQPESVSTSDEGYYDSFSPGLEEDKKEAPSPSTPVATFPRDSYSGDALYELFYDPSDSPGVPSLDDDPCVSESLSGPALGTPLSMCSFHMGAEENLAPAPGPDLLSQGFLQSTWKGKECLLKLCDTELAITMGIVNWLRRAPEPRTPPTAAPILPALEDPMAPLRAPRELVEKLGARGCQAPETPRATVCSAPSRQELWAQLGTQDLIPGNNRVPAGAVEAVGTPARDPFLEEGSRSPPDGWFSSVESVAAATMETSRKTTAPVSPAWLSLQKEHQPPGMLGCSQLTRKPAEKQSILSTEPTLIGCAVQLGTLRIDPEGQPPATQPAGQNLVNGLFKQPRVRRPHSPQREQPSSLASNAESSPASSPDLRHANCTLDPSWLSPEPAGPSTQACASVEDGPMQCSPGAVGRAAQRGQLDTEPPSATVSRQNPWSRPPEISGLALPSQWGGVPSASAPKCCCSLLAHEDHLVSQPEVRAARPATAEAHL
ncbi:APC membrane recruitment protein 3 [Ochotona princeps]|uniref:APC membrane recruitment protein 3 n=1 Tax=Ochotona princeps TaxID=9978 RepID=UPI0027144BFF|nr:APC membrane recruitment protein 3 [Ochotona princeps]